MLTEAKHEIFEPLLFGASSKPYDSKFGYDLVGCLIIQWVEVEVPFSRAGTRYECLGCRSVRVNQNEPIGPISLRDDTDAAVVAPEVSSWKGHG